MKIINTKVYGLENSITIAQLPYKIGIPETLQENLHLAQKLAYNEPGTGHNNFLKGIIVQFDLQYPQYFTPQLQRYHWMDIVSSQSKMHKLTSVKNIKDYCNRYVFTSICTKINALIEAYNTFNFEEKILEFEGIEITSKAECFVYILSNLPSGFELWMSISTNYLQLKTIYLQRKNHRLPEWKYFCSWIESLPNSDFIIRNNK